MIAGTGVVVGVGASPAFAVSCPDREWSLKDGRIGPFMNGTNINLRNGPSANCRTFAQGQLNDRIIYDCWKPGDGGSWTHLFDTSIGWSDWVKDSLLDDNGSTVRC